MNDMQLQAFMAAADCLNFSAAAEKLYLPPQAVRKYIQNLELELDTQLFIRRSGRVALTEAGALYYDIFSQSLKGLRELAHYNTNAIDEMRRHFRLGVSSWLSMQSPLGDAISAFWAQVPELELSIRVYDNKDLRRSFEKDELDMIILSSDFFNADVDTEHCILAPESLALYAPDWVPGDTVDPECWQLPYIQCAAWEWSYLEWKHIGLSMLDESDHRPRRLVLLPNTATVRSEMCLHRSVAVTDRFFGILRDIPGLRSFPIGLTPNLLAVWKKYNESPLIAELTAFIQRYFAPGGPGHAYISENN